MDFTIIDELFDIYKNENLSCAEDSFIQYYKNHEKYGEGYLVNLLKEYIKQQTNFVANYFVSNKDEVYSEHNLVRDFVTAFENLIMPVDFLLSDLVYQDYQLDQDCNNGEPIKMIKPHDLFNINIDLIEQAVNKYGECYIDDFNKIKDLITYVKKNNVLKRLYKDDSWYELDFEELIYNIYDFVEDKTIFKTEYMSSYQMEFFLFEKIKANCSEMLNGTFDKFRPNLNSTKQIRANFGKLIFCRNLLMFYETGIMPDYNGFIDFSVDSLEHIHLIDNFKKLYSKNFDEVSFRQHQGNFICNPEIYSNNYKLEAGKSVKHGNKLIIGFIVSCSDNMRYTKNDYLIHIEIDDVNNCFSNYEMQVSIIPHGELNYRLQLMRLDNWENEQSHRNVAKKLTTTTHVHIYNEFDILRGKTNGAFDIAYNIEGTGVAFETSLKTFLDILDFDDDISIKIYESTIKCLGSRKKIDVEKGI